MTFTIYVCKVAIVLEMVMDVCHRSLEIFNRFGKKREQKLNKELA